MKPRTLTILLAVAFLLNAPAFGQLDTASISGRITDSSAAVIGGAQITVVNTDTHFQSVTMTNNEGLFRVPSLSPGPYQLTVAASGFKQYVREKVDLQVGDNVAIDAALEVGAISDTIHVTAEAPQLQTETSSGGAVLEGVYLQGLPLYQRNVKATFYLTPGVEIQGFGYSGNLQGFHINGLQDSKVGYFQDGNFAVGNNNGTIYTADPIQSTVEEVKILATTLPAEYGHSAGGAMTAVQRTGTNTLHGEVSEFGRVSAMQHRKYFDLYHFGQVQPGQVATPSELFQEPNATLHGPVYIPKLYNGKNKTFFVFAVERLIEKQAKQQAYTVPDAAELAGDFSFGGHGVTANPLYDPLSTTQLANGTWTRNPIAGNLIPKSRIDPVAAKFISLTPWAPPNAPGTYSNTGPQNNFQGTYLKKVFWENYTGRLDHQFDPNFKIFANFTYNSRYQRIPNPQLSQPLFDSSLVTENDYQNTATLGATKILRSNLVNEFKVGYYRFEPRINSPDTNQNLAGLLGIPNVAPTLLPGGLPLSVGGPTTNIIENFTAKDDITWLKGSHSFKFGYDLLHMRQNSYSLGSPSGSFSFDGASGLTGNGTQTIPNTGGISLASFMLGSVSSATFSIPTATWLPRDNINSFYFQDDWRVSPSLTLNLGLRYVHESPWHTKYGQFSQFDPSQPDPLVPGSMGKITHPGGNITNGYNKEFDPRAGLAWHAREKLVVRTGFALMHVDLGNAPSQLDEYSISTTQSQVSGNPKPIYQISQGPLPIVYPALQPNGTQPFQGSNYSSRNTTRTDPNLHSPYVLTWNMNLQYQLRENYLLQLSYDGTAGIGNLETPQYNALPENYDANNPAALAAFVGNSQIYRPFPNYGTITYRGNISHSSYHGGTLRITKRYAKALTFDAFYTYSKSLDGSGVGNVDVASNLYKGLSSFDRRQRFVNNFSYDLPVGKGRPLLNRSGVLNVLFGGYTLVWTYDIYSGNPVTLGFTNSPYNYLPGFIGIGGRPNLLGYATLRDNWQDLGGDRFNEGNQNSTISSLADFAYPAAYTFGNAGKDTFITQRGIGASFSARKEFALKERLKLQLRFDFQNPFKWYNWGNMNTTVDLKNVVPGTITPTPANLFGKVPSGNEATTVADGGVPMMNATIKFVW
ncbi:MAG TPA: carboxypeptidase-like regulatory domain-containing protein [Bryobacteraceae bacterium]|nr:carboxypeptidase-like regulatory domain-containing protein [Bryobacteraceae bacterium]